MGSRQAIVGALVYSLDWLVCWCVLVGLTSYLADCRQVR